MDEWLTQLKETIEAAREDGQIVMTLATLSRNGSPRARAVVLRAVEEDGSIWFVSDARSKKNQQIQLDRRVEAVIWFAEARLQYRVRGEARVIESSDPRCAALWKQLSDATRAMFTWPTPGERRDALPEHFAAELSVDAAIPATFQAIAIHPTLVEETNLNPHPHRRRRWRRKTGWVEEELNP
ncbi:MAG TPA: pyridoxamine 5'-phosphate oxidase family protein [Tepidisphaeraceae bacterium]|jgi:pyridoxamine 5'-phosphate oxidase|nr:pyridoxamine 5'-phosphate oxidase family protein [Tepidisphaeraceae bacterium]